jgi:hypothetical protein
MWCLVDFIILGEKGGQGDYACVSQGVNTYVKQESQFVID